MKPHPRHRPLLVATLALLGATGIGATPGDRAGHEAVADALGRVDAHLAAGRPADALALLEGLARDHGEDPLFGWQIADRRGAALLAAGRPAEALPLLEGAVARSPLVPEHHRNLADALRRMGRRGRALSEYQQTVELAPTEAVHRLELGYALLEFRMWRRAEVEFAAALSLCRCDEAERGLAEALFGQGRPDAAVAPLRRLHASRPTADRRRDLLAALQAAGADSGVMALLAVVPLDSLTGDEALALVQAEGALGGEPRHSLRFVAERTSRPPAAGGMAVFWGRISLNLLAAGRPAEALSAADAAVVLAPADAVYRQNRAAVLHRLGREAEARREAAEAQRLQAAKEADRP